MNCAGADVVVSAMRRPATSRIAPDRPSSVRRAACSTARSQRRGSVAGVYATDAVKHFKWMQSGKRRLHGKPGAREIEACRPWLEAEAAGPAPASPLINI